MSPTYQVYKRLFEMLGPQHWWPGDSPWEVMVGAVLVQNTAWRNVERAIANLRDEDLLDPHRLTACHPEALSDLIRPAGYYRLKTGRLLNLMRFIVEQFDGSLGAMRNVPWQDLREQLLQVKGIGPETADSILLYALNQPALVVDTYTHRIFARHGWIGYEADYHQLQEHLASELPEDVPLYNDLHALLVHVGHHWCRRKPKCEECPLAELLPADGITEPGE